MDGQSARRGMAGHYAIGRSNSGGHRRSPCPCQGEAEKRHDQPSGCFHPAASIFLRLAGRRRGLCRYLRRLRLRLFVQRFHRIAAARFRRDARFRFAGVFARRISLLRPRRGERPARRSMGLAPRCPDRNRPDRSGTGAGKLRAKPADGLRGLQPWRRSWRGFLLRPLDGRGATLVHQTPWFRVRSRLQRHRRRGAGRAAIGGFPDRRLGMARCLSRSRRSCADHRRRHGVTHSERTTRARPRPRWRAHREGNRIRAGFRIIYSRRNQIRTLYRSLCGVPRLLVRCLCPFRASDALCDRSWHRQNLRSVAGQRHRHRQHRRDDFSSAVSRTGSAAKYRWSACSPAWRWRW